MIELFDNRIEACSGDGRHVKNASDGVASALTDAFSFPTPAFSGEGSDAGERSYLFSGKKPWFGHLGDESGGKHGADAGNGLEQFGGLAPGIGFINAALDLGFYPGGLALERCNVLFQFFANGRMSEFEAIVFGEAHFDKLAAAGVKGLQSA